MASPYACLLFQCIQMLNCITIFSFFSLGDEWLKLRKSLAPAFHHLNNPSHFSKDMNHICDDFIELLRHVRDQDTNIISNLQEVVFRLSLEGE